MIYLGLRGLKMAEKVNRGLFAALYKYSEALPKKRTPSALYKYMGCVYD
jgi:hypothetical protein